MRERGFGLLTTCISMGALLGIAGLAVDVGRMYITKSELQAFADSAALAAVAELDGTEDGLERARAIGQTGPVDRNARPNQWNFGTEAVPRARVEFSRDGTEGWTERPDDAAGLRYVRVETEATAALYFLPVIPGITNHFAVPVLSSAGQVRSKMGSHADPFSIVAPSPNAEDFGFTPAQTIPADYVDLGQKEGDSQAYGAILSHRYYNEPPPVGLTDTIHLLDTSAAVGLALKQRFYQDSDTQAKHAAEYRGNGRRLLHVLVRDAASNIAGYATLLLLEDGTEFVGSSALIGGRMPAERSKADIFKLRLTQGAKT